MDAARTARRLGASEVRVAYRRGREEMPAHTAEVDEAEMEGVVFEFLVAPVDVVTDAAGAVSGLRCQRMQLGEADASGRRRPEPIPGSEYVIPCGAIVSAIGMEPDDRPFEAVTGRRSGTPDQGRPHHPAERPSLPVRRRRRRGRRHRHHARHRPRPPRRLHDRQLAERPSDGRVPAVRRPAGRRGPRRGPRAAAAATRTAGPCGPTASTPAHRPTSPRSSRP